MEPRLGPGWQVQQIPAAEGLQLQQQVIWRKSLRSNFLPTKVHHGRKAASLLFKMQIYLRCRDISEILAIAPKVVGDGFSI